MTNDNATNLASVAVANSDSAKAAAAKAHQENLHAPDFVNELFVRTSSEDCNLIKFNDAVWSQKSPEEKIDYLHKLASSMNHAALKIQDERDELVKLLIHKEATIEKLGEQLGNDRLTIHKQLERENLERQKLLEENQRLYVEIAALQKLLKDAGIEYEE